MKQKKCLRVALLVMICSGVIILSSCANNSVSEIEHDKNEEACAQYTPSSEWSKDRTINTITSVEKRKEIKVRAFDETTKENELKVKELYETKGKYVPQPIKMKYNFDDYYLSLKKLEKNEVIDQVIVWSDELGTKRLIIREGKMLYEIASVSRDKIEYFSEGRIISDNCKKIVECSKTFVSNGSITDMWGYITEEGDFHYYGTACYDSDTQSTVDIFGKQLLRDYDLPRHDGDVVLTNIDDVWIIDWKTFVYLKDKVLYKVTGYNEHQRVFVGDIMSVSGICSWPYSSLVIFSTKNGELYGFGSNYKKFIDENKNKKYIFTTATKINVPFKVKDVTVVMKGIYVVDFDNELYFWGNLGKKNEDLYIPLSKPLLIASNVEELIPGKRKVYCFDHSGILSTYQVVRSDEKREGKYYIQIKRKHESSGFEKFFNKDFMISDNVLIFNPNCLKYRRVYEPSVYVDESTEFSANWWVSYGNYKLTDFYASTPFLVDSNVEDISGSRYFKEGNWYKFNKDGTSSVFLKGKVDKLFAYSDEYFYLKNSKIYSSSSELRHFDYKKDLKKQKKKHIVMEKNVTDVWANSENIAFVKDGTLYSYGLIEHLRWKGYKKGRLHNYPDGELPNLVSYSGINVKKIINISFDKRNMYILMKSGKTYKITPEQKEKQEWYRKTCHISDDMYMKERGIVSISQTDFYYPHFSWFKLKSDGTVMHWKTKVDSDEKKKIEYLTDIKAYAWSTSSEQYYESHAFYVIKTNGDLYGWGRNYYGEIKTPGDAYISFKDKVLVADNVKKISIPDDTWYCQSTSLFYLTNHGELYFKGYRSAF